MSILNNHVETLKLLNASESESPSDIPDFSTAPRRKVKVKRKFRPSNQFGKTSQQSSSSCSIWVIVRWLGILSVVIFILAASWFLYCLYDKILILTQRLQDLESGTRKTPEEFHIVHSQLNLLDGNNTANQESIAKITETLTSLNKDIEGLRKKTDGLSKSIAAEPQITMLPQTVESLQGSVATLGSKITNVDSIAKELKEQTNSMNKEWQAKIEALQKRVDGLANDTRLQETTTAKPSVQTVEQLEHLGVLFGDLNKTMTVSFLSVFEDLHKLHANVTALQNSSAVLANRLALVESKTAALENIPKKINEIVQEKVNQNLQKGTVGDMLIGNNLTVKDLFGYVENLTEIYHTLLTNFSQQKQEEGDLMNSTVSSVVQHYFSKKIDSVNKQQMEQIESLSNQVEDVRKRLEEIKIGPATTSNPNYVAESNTARTYSSTVQPTQQSDSSQITTRRKLQQLQFSP